MKDNRKCKDKKKKQVDGKNVPEKLKIIGKKWNDTETKKNGEANSGK
jgi:hypothetical protein